MNTTYTSRLNPQFQNAGVQDVSMNLKPIKESMGTLIKQNENELKALRSIAQDQAQIDFNRGAAELVDKYGTDFKGLGEAMSQLENNLYNQIKPVHPDIAEDLLRQYDSVRLRAVDAAHRKYIADNDRKIKEGTTALLDGYKMALPDDYANYLDNLRKPAEERDNNIIGQWSNNLQQIDILLNRKDMNGNYIYDDKTRKQKKFLQEHMFDGAKNMIDRFITANDKAGLQNYYQAHILAPERYMKETGQDRDTYDKVKKYAETQLSRMDVDAKKLKFEQSIANAMGLQREFSDAKLAELEESGILPEKVLKSLKETNVKFSSVDPTKAELPTAMIDVLDIVNSFDSSYGDGWDEQVNTIETGLAAMDKLADYAQEHGLTERNIKRAKEMIISKEQDAVFSKVYDKFGGIIDDFTKKRAKVRQGPTTFGAITNWDGMPNAERNKITQLEIVLGSATDQIHAAYMKGEPISPILNKTYAQVARIRYPEIAWSKIDENPEAKVDFHGEIVKIVGYTDDGDIIIER